MEMFIIVVAIGVVCLMLPLYYRNIFKVSYYETTLKLNKNLFDPEVFENIEKIMKDKWAFLKIVVNEEHFWNSD